VAVTRVSPLVHVRYILGVRFEKIWIEQCRATKAIKRRFGAKSALDYLIGEKLLTFANVAREHPTFAKELPKFLAGIWQVFNEYEIAGYVASRKPIARKRQILPLLRRERLRCLGGRWALFFRKRLLDARQPSVHGIEHPSHARFRTVVRFRRHMAGKIVDVI
jgi:hypothetical protein